MGKHATVPGYLIFSAIVACLGGILFGYFTAVISGVLLFVSPMFNLTIAQQGTLVSSILAGGILGSAWASTVTDGWGRRSSMMLAALLFISSGLLQAFAQSYEMLIGGRLIGGLGVGLTSVVCPLYLAEISPPKIRGTLISSYQLAITLGILLSFGVNYFFAFSQDWRSMCSVGVIPAGLFLLGLGFLRETPPFLLRQGKPEQARRALASLRQGGELSQQLAELQGAASAQTSGRWQGLFQPKIRLIVLIGILLSVFQQITGINAVIYYGPKIFALAGSGAMDSALLATFAIGVVNVVATIFSVWSFDKVGRRSLLLLGLTGMSLALLVLAAGFYGSAPWLGTVSLVSLMVYVSFFAISLGPVTWVIIAEIYPLRIRGKAMTVAIMANWATNFLVSRIFLDLVALLAPSGVFLLFAGLSIIGLVFVYRLIPETRGKSLAAIEAELG